MVAQKQTDLECFGKKKIKNIELLGGEKIKWKVTGDKIEIVNIPDVIKSVKEKQGYVYKIEM